MTAGSQQARPVRRERRIIERPRLTKRLDEAEASTILLFAPAGYGKTTLARQWGRTLSRTIWVSATPSHRDVVTFSEDVAAGIDGLGGNASRFIGEYMRARTNPQRAAREIAGVLATRVEDARVQWIVIDDYQELAESPEVDEMVAILRERLSARFLVASRVRPSWATARNSIYGDVDEFVLADLALTEDETAAVLGRRPDLAPLVEKAAGWPAVVSLAACLDAAGVVDERLPADLHDYVAEELFRSAALELQQQLISLALLPDLRPETLAREYESDATSVLSEARELGFVNGENPPELHALLREFLLVRLGAEPDAEERVRQAVANCLAAEAWGRALGLVLRFDLADLVEPVLQQAYRPLLESGRLGTLASFARHVDARNAFPPRSVEIINAEVAFHDGQYALAINIARRVDLHVEDRHPLKSRLSAIAGQSYFFLGESEKAENAFQRALATAQDRSDRGEALHGIAAASVFDERDDATAAVAAVAAERHASPRHLLRFAAVELCRLRFAEGIKGALPIDEALGVFSQVADPRARTSFTYGAANVYAERAEYHRALRFVDLFERDVTAYNLDFARPYLLWTSAFVQLGLRRFAEVGRLLDALDALLEETPDERHSLNSRILRARLMVQIGRFDDALEQLHLDDDVRVIRSWRGEYLATLGLALACSGADDESLERISLSDRLTKYAEVRVLNAASRALVSARNGSDSGALDLIALAEELGAWDPVVCAVRASPDLAAILAEAPQARPALERLYKRSGDFALAKRAGMRSRSFRPAREILSPREIEVLGLLATGFRNREIASALYIAESTVKVHVRHLLEKLGVRTRAEAVARYAYTEAASASGESTAMVGEIANWKCSPRASR